MTSTNDENDRQAQDTEDEEDDEMTLSDREREQQEYDDEMHNTATDSEDDLGEVVSIYYFAIRECREFGGDEFVPDYSNRITFRRNPVRPVNIRGRPRYLYTAHFRYGSFRGTWTCKARENETWFNKFEWKEWNGSFRHVVQSFDMHFKDVLDDDGNLVLAILIDCGWDHGPEWIAGYAKKDVGAGPVLLSEGEKERLDPLPRLDEDDDSHCC